MIKYLSPFKAQTLTTGNVTAYIVPKITVTQIRALTFHNASTGNVTVKAYLLPSNVSTPTEAQRLLQKTLAAGDSYLCPEIVNHVLSEGQQVVLVGEGVNAMLSVMEQPA